MNREKAHINVFVTKSRTFRAHVKDETGEYEVTVGGKQWRYNNKGKKHRIEILKKCLELISGLNKIMTNELREGNQD